MTLLLTQQITPWKPRITHADEQSNDLSIVITEIAASEKAALEWIEIQNISDRAINLEGWKFFEDNTNHSLNLYEGSFTLRSEEIAIIANRADQLKAAYPNLTNTILDSSWGSLKESGEEIGLKNNDSQLSELFTYVPHEEDTLQRINISERNYSTDNWMVAKMTIGQPNLTNSKKEIIEEYAATINVELQKQIETDETPGTPNIDKENSLQKNIQPSPQKSPTPTKPIARITIQSGVTQSYKKVTINLDGSKSTDPQNQDLSYYWDLGDGSIYENKNPRTKSYKEPGTYRVTLRVTNESGLFDETFIEITVLPEEETTITTNNTSQASESTSISSNTTTTKTTNEETTQDSILQTYPSLLLSEIMPNPTGSDTNQEWIEIYNPNDFPVNTKNYTLDDLTDAGSSPMKLQSIEIQPKSHYLVFDPTISLNNSKEEIQLFDPNGTLLDKIYFAEAKEGQSLARLKQEWLWTTFPTPNYKNEIISEELEVTEKEVQSEFQNGDLSAYIYFSEILPNPKGEDAPNEWIELYNAGNEPVNLGNWILDDNEKGSKPFTIPDTYTIQPNSYLIIERSESKIGLDNRSETVRLFNYEDELQDEITYERAKENISFAKLHILNEDTIEPEWKWTPKITKGKTNPRLYKVRGEVENKIADTVLIKAKKLSLQEDNELNEIALQPGNLVELTYDESNQIKDYRLIKEKTREITPTTSNKKLLYETMQALILILTIAYIIQKKKAEKARAKNLHTML